MTTIEHTLQGLAQHMPIQLINYNGAGKKLGLVVVDEVNGFCTVGAGNLAPAVPNAAIDSMVKNTVALANDFLAKNLPIFAFRDTHVARREEPPYPEHCVVGTGEEQLVDDLRFLEQHEGVTIWNKDCINGFVGAQYVPLHGINAMTFTNEQTPSNAFVDWVNKNNLEGLVVVGICSEICVLDFVVTTLSARNHFLGAKPMMPTLRDIVVYEPAVSTYELNAATVAAFKLPGTALHVQELEHHVGLRVMQARGAILANNVSI